MPTTYDADTLKPVTTTVSKLPVAPSEDELATVTIRADRIPWYAWMGMGLLAGFVLGSALSSRN
jgi:hypothetical protein